MEKIELRHSRLGLCDTVNVVSELQKDRLIASWKSRYGKTFYDCSVTVTEISKQRGRHKSSKKVVYIKTGDIYDSARIAADEFKISYNTIIAHCRKNNQPSFNSNFKWA